MCNWQVTSRLLFLLVLPHHSQSTCSSDLRLSIALSAHFPNKAGSLHSFPTLQPLCHQYPQQPSPLCSGGPTLVTFHHGRAGGPGPPQVHAFGAAEPSASLPSSSNPIASAPDGHLSLQGQLCSCQYTCPQCQKYLHFILQSQAHLHLILFSLFPLSSVPPTYSSVPRKSSSPPPKAPFLCFLRLSRRYKQVEIPAVHENQSNTNRGFPGGSASKASAYSAGDPGSIPESGRSPGEENGNPLQYSCLENSMDRGAWWATVHGVTKSRT